jgi:predicted ester cyclase
MSTKEVKALVRHFFEESNKGKKAVIAVVDETCDINYVYHTSSGSDENLNDFKQDFSGYYDAFPDLHWTIHDIIVEGDKAAYRFTFTGTHRGKFMGIPPTNKKVTSWFIEIDRVSNGKFVEGWVRSDTLGFLQQLGVTPTSKK